MRATITSTITAVYQPFHCLLRGDEGGVGPYGDETRGVTGAEDPCIASGVEVGELCNTAASVGPPDAEIEPDCHEEEVGVESWGVEYTGATEPGLLEECHAAGEENAKEGEDEEGVQPTPP